MATTPPLNIREATAADVMDLTILETELQATPEPLYLFPNYASMKYGPKRTGQGSKVQVNRLEPLESPDPDNLDAYLAGTGRNAISTLAGNLQSLNWTKVTVQVRRYHMPSPVAEKYETEQLSQLDLIMAHKINLRRNYHEFIDDLIRETIRAAVCTIIYGNSLRNNAIAMTSDASTDGFGVHAIKEYRRRAARLFLRAFGSVPGSDMQALAGSYLCITDQHGVNEFTEDEQWLDWAKRHPQTRENLIKGYVGEYAQTVVVKSDRMRTVDVGPTGDPYEGHEALFLASDPVLLDPGENGVQGFVGELPVVMAMLGTPIVRKASEDNFGEDLIYTWLHTLGTQALEELLDTTATALTAILGGNNDAWKGICANGSSRYIHKCVFV